MKTPLDCLLAAALLGGSGAWAQTDTYTNFIRQVQFPSGVQWDASVAAAGQQLSALAIDPGGARFELWTVKSAPLTSYLLASCYVGPYIPVAEVVITSEERSSRVPRTRADRPFFVDVTINGLLAGAADPAASKQVNFLHHIQSYGAGGTGIGLDRTQATLMSQSAITANGTQTLTFLINSVPGADRAKVRGEERFTVFSLPDPDCQAPSSQLSATVQN
ncbi:MAG: hypothetical protein NTW21_35815 [Verrucomicrobia bacterium]|nr:hypothetical protein [Verrucomicrobiota bacterium]